MDIVVDEWLPDYLRSREEVGIVIEVLKKIFEVCDSIAVMEGSPFMRKIYRVLKESEHWNDPAQILTVRYFIGRFLTNSEKMRRYRGISTNDLPKEVLEAIQDQKDLYLVATLLHSLAQDRGGIILTTDAKLKKGSTGDISRYIVLLKEFLKKYPFKEV
ncbi:MAG: hypothetical protein DRN55_08255 [Thermoplasmata archaeon]|nr:MAG: hypothetical protein DRN55_08255 [Thermoplasmata archaeon]